MESGSGAAARGRLGPRRPLLRHRRRQARRPAAARPRPRQIRARQAGGRPGAAGRGEGGAATGGIAAGLDDLPLFAAAVQEEAAPDAVHAALAEVEPDSLAPREALELIYRLKRLAEEPDA